MLGKEIIKVAIVDDNENDFAVLKEFLERYQINEGKIFDIKSFNNGVVFLESIKNNVYNIVLMDIEMPHCDGMQAAKKMREADESSTLIFVTNMAQFAAHGYDVDAMAFLLKPVNYARFSAILTKAIVKVDRRLSEEIIVQTSNGMRRINLSDIYYVQIEDHLLVYYMENGHFESWQTLKDAELNLPAERFGKCNKSTLVNFKHIQQIEKNIIIVGKGNLVISRREKKDFMIKFTKHFGD